MRHGEATHCAFVAGINAAVDILNGEPGRPQTFAEQQLRALLAESARAGKECRKCSGCVDYSSQGARPAVNRECLPLSQWAEVFAGRSGAIISMLGEYLVGASLVMRKSNGNPAVYIVKKYIARNKQ